MIIIVHGVYVRINWLNSCKALRTVPDTNNKYLIMLVVSITLNTWCCFRHIWCLTCLKYPVVLYSTDKTPVHPSKLSADVNLSKKLSLTLPNRFGHYNLYDNTVHCLPPLFYLSHHIVMCVCMCASEGCVRVYVCLCVYMCVCLSISLLLGCDLLEHRNCVLFIFVFMLPGTILYTLYI